MKSKILIVSYEYPPNIQGGSGTHIFNLVQRLYPHFDLEVLTIDRQTSIGNGYPSLPIKVTRIKTFFKRFPFYNIEFIIKAHQYILKHSYDFIHDHTNGIIHENCIHTIHSSYLQEFNCFKTKNPFRLIYGKIGYYLLHGWEILVYKKSRLLICTSRGVKNHLEKYFRTAAEKKIVHYGIDTSLFKPTKQKKKYDLLFVGRFAEIKNIPFLLEVLDHLPKSLTICFCGYGTYENFIRKWSHKTHHTVIIHHDVNYYTLNKYYNQSKLTVLSSYHESFGLSLAESLACETSVICTDTEGVHEFVESGYNGFIVHNRDEFVQKIKLLLSNNSLRREFGKHGRTLIDKKFSWKSQIKKYLNLYSNMVQK